MQKINDWGRAKMMVEGDVNGLGEVVESMGIGYFQ